MDNVTHSLAGLLLAELARELHGRPVLSRRVAAVTAIVAANLPDGDLLYAGAPSGLGKLGYLLHHRGHTHTVVAALLGAVLVWGAALAWWRWVRRTHHAPATRDDRRWLLGLCVAGTLSHLLLDFTNNYGVHPFWPFDNGWHYGDAVFILEPWLWVAAVPPLVLAIRGRAARGVLALLLVGVLIAAWRVDMVARGAALTLTLGTLAWFALAAVVRPGRRIAAGVMAWCVVEIVFFGASHAARSEVERAAIAVGAAPLVDVALTPAVSDPLCFDALVVEADATTYRASTVTVAPFPRLLPASRCAGAQYPSATRPASASVRWRTEWSAPRAELAALARDNCVVAAALRFVRVPVWLRDTTTVSIADLRFSRGGGGFAEIEAPIHPTTCPAHLPPWTPPRAALLAPLTDARADGHPSPVERR